MNTFQIINISRKKNKNRKGRGMSQGNGKTCGRGQKGQRCRSGSKIRIGFEGGQTPLYLRIPKFGFYSPKNNDLFAINLARISEIYNSGEEVSIATLVTKKIISANKIKRVKILGEGVLSTRVSFAPGLLFSQSAKKKISSLT